MQSDLIIFNFTFFLDYLSIIFKELITVLYHSYEGAVVHSQLGNVFLTVFLGSENSWTHCHGDIVGCHLVCRFVGDEFLEELAAEL